MSSSNENTVLSAVGARTILNFVCKLLFRFLHFFLNSLILHHIEPSIIGIANVRLQLLYTTITFLSREAFRRTIPKSTSLGSIHHYINLTWLIIPAGLTITLFALPITLFVGTNGAEQYPYFYHACVFYAAAAFIEFLSEPLYLLASLKLNYHVNIYIEMFASMVGFSIQAILIFYNRKSALYYYGLGYVIYSLLITSSYYLYFFISNAEKRHRLFGIKSLKDLTIKLTTPYVDHKLLNETTTFFWQGIWMKLLTEGERYVMALFNLVSHTDQGIFDTVNNLGSLLPRLIFSTLEESAYTYFQQTLKRKETNDENTSASGQRTIVLNALKFYNYLLRFVIVLSFLLIAFGTPYSRFFLNIYGGSKLTEGPGVTLLQLYCIYILFLAVNGITEAFAQATMSIDELKRYKNLISIFAVIYLGLFYVLMKFIGIHGIIIANCLNMLFRIAQNVPYIYRYFRGIEWSKPFEFSWIYIVSLIVCSFLCFYSERWFSHAFFHFSFGAVLGLVMLLLTWREEREMIHYIYCMLRLNREKKKI